MTDQAISGYVTRIRWDQTAVFGMFSRRGSLLGAVELAAAGKSAELAIAVLSTQKRRGIGRALVARALVHARVHGLRKLQLLCSADNVAMQKLALGIGMKLTREYGEIEGLVNVGRPTPADYMSATWRDVDGSVGAAIAKLQRALRPRRPTSPGISSPSMEKPSVETEG